MIQLNGVTPFSINTSDEPTLINAAGHADGTSFQSQLSVALTSTLEKFGINPNNVNLSIAPIVTGSTKSKSRAAETASATPASAQSSDGTRACQDPVLSFDAAYWASSRPLFKLCKTLTIQPSARWPPLNWPPPAIRLTRRSWSGAGIRPKSQPCGQDMGYTWVPSAFQNPVAAAPGLTNGSEGYDPKNPPSGSIAV